jgi:hypothetical protein
MRKKVKSIEQVNKIKKEVEKVPDSGRKSKFRNKEKVLVVSSRGITFRCVDASLCENRS